MKKDIIDFDRIEIDHRAERKPNDNKRPIIFETKMDMLHYNKGKQDAKKEFSKMVDKLEENILHFKHDTAIKKAYEYDLKLFIRKCFLDLKQQLSEDGK